MQNLKINNRIFIGIAFAMAVNIFLFALLPVFVKSDFQKSDLEIIMPVNLVKITPLKPLPEKEEKLPEKQPSEKTIPTVRLQHKVSRKQSIKMEMPKFSFEINPKLSAGMPVAPPTPVATSYEIGDVDRMPMVIFKMKPVYPYRAKRLNITGKVDVKFLVDENGYVSKIKIIKATPPGIFDESVLKALPSWKFSPGGISGNAVSTWVITTIEFDMGGTN